MEAQFSFHGQYLELLKLIQGFFAAAGLEI